MKNLVISLGNICNSYCLFCKDGQQKVSSESKIVDIEKIKSKLIFYFNLGCKTVVFLGGEPLINPNLLKIIYYSKQIGYENIEISTNGLCCDNERLIRQLLLNGVNHFTVSIHSHLPEVEEYLTGVPGSLLKKIKGIKFLIKCLKNGLLKNGIMLNPVINSKNYRELKNYIKYFYKLGIRYIHFNFIGGSIYMWPLGKKLKATGLMPYYNEIIPYLIEAVYYTRMHMPDIKIRFSDIPICGLPLNNDYIRKYLNQIITNYFSEVKSESFVYINNRELEWDKFIHKEFKILTNICKCCEYKDYCGGILKNYIKVHGFKGIAKHFEKIYIKK